MPSSEDVIRAHDDVRTRCVAAFVKEGHAQKSAEEIVKYMSYSEQAAKIGQPVGQPYSPY